MRIKGKRIVDDDFDEYSPEEKNMAELEQQNHPLRHMGGQHRCHCAVMPVLYFGPQAEVKFFY